MILCAWAALAGFALLLLDGADADAKADADDEVGRGGLLAGEDKEVVVVVVVVEEEEEGGGGGAAAAPCTVSPPDGAGPRRRVG